jgi:hypothetical protein
MNQIPEEVWAILLPDEKMALGLQYSMDKSSWQAGEIMNKSHYKYLEIRYRAEKFLKMFKEHLDLFIVVIPDFIQGDEIVKQYFNLCITQRMKPGSAIEQVGNIKKKQLDAKIIKTMALWADPNNGNEFVLYNLVREFDRWNNFRILPEPIREPSAFKRRVKNAYKRQVRMMGELSPLAVKKINQLCKVPTKKYNPYFYLPLVNKKKVEIIRVKGNKRTTELLTELNLYYFKKLEDATMYIESLHKYLVTPIRECTDGLNFWPVYRDYIKKATNYEAVQKITPTRRYLEMAVKNLQFYNYDKKR